ncbi:STY4199 family HEPN domain-containing protein [Atlantibacter sp.]|uniref:STY4199 family HEPN domain-containing protein n=1 Tax=Atlantibacter sp. TaxID=1903473 RepID=UPI0028A6C60D|nr:STY4199 family HEPN domain-containing protein [Atlantibacter sp.]
MTRSAQLIAREQFEAALQAIREASKAILSLLGNPVAEAKDPQWFLQQMDNARQHLGSWGLVAKRLHINDAELSQFTLQLRHLQQLVPQYESGAEVSATALIAALRFVATLERVRLRQPLLHYNTELALSQPPQPRAARVQLRSLELTLTGLIREAWPDEVTLVNHLKLLFGANKVRRWLKFAKPGDILSGMQFSELAQLVVDKKEFAKHYAAHFPESGALSFLIEPRKSLLTFLDDVRLIRNHALGQQPLSPVQMTLLENYSAAITAPLQQHHVEGKTPVNPASFSACDDNELEAWFADAAQKHQAMSGDIFEIRDVIESPRHKPPRTREQREQLVVGVLWSAVGLVAVAIAVGGLHLVNQTRKPVAASQPVAYAAPVEPLDARESTPRQQLNRLGIAWDENHFRSAIDRDDDRIARLFLQAGMEWKVSWTEQALASKQHKVLDLLLSYRVQMNEPKPCRRMIANLGHALSQGQPFTAIRKTYLKAFCTTPAVVKRQASDAAQAQARAAATRDKSDEKWAAIQKAIYSEIN